MRFPTLILSFVLALSLLSSDAAWSADFWKGYDAYRKGDYATALQEWEPLAEQGYVEAQNFLGRMYRYGEGVAQSHETSAMWYERADDASLKGNYATALREWESFAEQGHALAQFFLGMMYREGVRVAQSYEDAAGWYRRAAEQGYAPAQFALGRSYHFGHGVSQNYETAAEWYRRAAE
ncbi:MAG: sel1 repeat family protein, partial [Alphaproteobacteria bacterium]|nr:sel1 repeat family protein [Alphaproteobacteria bacterium]